MAKHTTGIMGLDKLLGGGIADGKTAMLFAPPGCGKSTICKEFAIESLKRGKRVLYISTGQTYTDWLRETKAAGKLHFIDGFSWRQAGESPAELDNVTVLSSITDLNELSLDIRKAIKGLGGLDALVLDSVSDLVLYSEPKSVFRFLQMLQGTVTANRAAGVVALEEGLHEDKVNSTISYIFNATIELRIAGSRRELRIRRMDWGPNPLEWHECKLKGNLRLELKGV